MSLFYATGYDLPFWNYHLIVYKAIKTDVLLNKGVFMYFTQNYLIIQITEVQHAIDQLKRKLDTDKMKLIIEVKVICISPNQVTFILK